MKNLLCVVAVMALIAAPALADTLEIRVVTTGGASSVAANCPFDVFIQGRLVDGDTLGLALWSANLTATGDVNLCDTTEFLLEAPAGDMQQFNRNLGLTNPPGPPSEITGYSGTCNGAGGLWQLGGAQNTINNDGPTEYPTGIVVEGVGNDGWVTLAQGRMNGPTGGATITLSSVFANTLNVGGGPELYPVAAAQISIVGGLTILPGCASTALCPHTDVNCDNVTDGFDIALIRRSDNWLKPVEDAFECRADVNSDGVIDGFDIALVRRSDCWLQ